MSKTMVYAQRGNWGHTVELLVRHGSAFGLPVVMEQVEEGARVSPTVVLERGEAQGLMDQLWEVGLRPSEGTGSAGSLRATERHLEDMRKLVAETLKVPL